MIFNSASSSPTPRHEVRLRRGRLWRLHGDGVAVQPQHQDDQVPAAEPSSERPLQVPALFPPHSGAWRITMWEDLCGHWGSRDEQEYGKGGNMTSAELKGRRLPSGKEGSCEMTMEETAVVTHA